MIIHNMDQGSEEWLAVRAGKPTASNASKLVTSQGKPSKSMPAYAEELAGEIYAGRPLDTWEGNKYTERGKELEDEARMAYDFECGVITTKVGFVCDDEENYGCSPDGLVGEDGLVEIKCLPKKHIAALRYWHKNKRIVPDYVPQVNMQLQVTERGWCDVVFYQPGLPTLVARVEADPAVQKCLSEQLEKCLEERELVLQILRTF